jgi:hypothetical protein
VSSWTVDVSETRPLPTLARHCCGVGDPNCGKLLTKIPCERMTPNPNPQQPLSWRRLNHGICSSIQGILHLENTLDLL